MDVEGGIDMRAAQDDEGSREVCRYIQRSSYPRLVDIIKRRWRNLRIRWGNLMKFQPSQENACVRILHKVPGLKQSAQAGLHVLARAFWLLVFVLCVGIVFYIIREGIRRTMGHPLTVTFETEEINIGDAKFPQVGIGPNGGFKLSSINDAMRKLHQLGMGIEVLANDGSAWTQNDVEEAMKVIDHTCDGDATYASKNGIKIQDEHTSFARHINVHETHVDNVSYEGVKQRIIPFIREGMTNCAEIIKGCLLNGQSYDCSVLFKQHYSAWGSTCVFNGIPGKATRRHSTIQSELGGSTNEEVEQWKQADLDEDVANVNKKSDTTERPAVPWRQMAPGKLSGLAFSIREELDNKACIHSDGTGFTLGINNPRDEMQVEQFGVTLPYGREIDVAIYPEVLLAEKDAKDIELDRRGCYFSDDEGDAHLEFYRKYSRQNCLEECFAKAVYAKCECAKVSSPEEEEKMHNQGLKRVCPKCLPNCRDIKYRTSVTSSQMTERRMNDYKDMYDGPMGDKKFTISVVNVFFMVDSVHPTRRSARYSTFEEVGLVGGTVSMITGLTLLDVIEVLVLIAVIAVARYKVWNNLRNMGGPSFNWTMRIFKFLRRNNRVAPEEIEMDTVQPRPVERPQRSALERPFHPYENFPGFIP
ncbi:pickpocket protein 28 [Folsomia candida]|uniref:pickpocket protein 28 n=1 Tax=Folsomia candida TaxID=158441 RepID=UPI000B906688|nr:pickpocket protein 28 [Folsomia candida]